MSDNMVLACEEIPIDQDVTQLKVSVIKQWFFGNGADGTTHQLKWMKGDSLGQDWETYYILPNDEEFSFNEARERHPWITFRAEGSKLIVNKRTKSGSLP